MKQIIEILENDKIKTYKISYNDEKIKELKKKIKEYSAVRELEIRYDCMIDSAESYVTASPYINFDEFMGVVSASSKTDKEVYETDLSILSHDLPIFGGPSYVTERVKLKNYPYLFNILFKKNKDNKYNIFKKILLYLNNDPTLTPSIDNNIKDILQEFCGIEVPKLIYDENISLQEKMLLIGELFNSMIITFESEESLLEINSQIKVVSKINIRDKSHKTNLIKVMKERIKSAKENKEIIDSINDYFMKNNSCDNLEKEKALFLQRIN